MKHCIRGTVTACLLAFGAPQAWATFHLIDINEVYSNADGTVQFVELIAFNIGQTQLSEARLNARGPNGTPVVLILDLTTNFPALGNGETILIATAGFQAVAGFAPDYVIPNNSLIPFPAGRVSWEDDPGQFSLGIVDAVAYGAYTGINTNFGTPAFALPCNGRQSLTRIRAHSTVPDNNSSDFALRIPSPKRNDGMTVPLQLPVGTDCNTNNSPDLCDIATGFSTDMNGNHVPDECDPPPGCQSDPNTCDDHNVCNGLETCNLGSGQCIPGTPLTCDDQNLCTVDDCDSVSGCFSEPVNCDDASPCTLDACDPEVGCVNQKVCPPGYTCQGAECLCSNPPGDFNGDGHLDSTDTLHELGCLRGPDGELLADCDCADLDGDGDIDLLDVADHLNDLSAP